MSEEEAVKVAVRVRPFNKREEERKAKLIIKMSGNQTVIVNPETKEEKNFAFDHSYWSHDGFKEDSDGLLQPASHNYASQQMVFNDLGQGVLDNAWEGYNCSLFAYGQTGSGKSYSMVGYGANKGIVPITCDELFKAIQANPDSSKVFEVTFSMLEIYNEQVRDLLVKSNPKGGLAVRQHPSQGFYVDKLKKIPVGSYREIETRVDEGTRNRTVASTNMNATSSRAHTVVTITFDQVTTSEDGTRMKKSSVMNLVDLAGSERAESTGATGDRLKEGANINKSLSALGNVISALAELSTGKAVKGKMVPYRDSVLTKLLQNALGGNSKTIMIAALSPADINYDETLSTLRYADRAKQIKNKAIVNESQTDKLIRELREENDKLKRLLDGNDIEALMAAAGATAGVAMSEADIENMRAEMMEQLRLEFEANEKAAKRMEGEGSWEDELMIAQSDISGVAAIEQKKLNTIHISNLNEDPMLTRKIVHFIVKEETSVGRYGDEQEDDISLAGLSIKKEHCTFVKEANNEVLLIPMEGAKTKVNGDTLTGPMYLQHMDRLLFGQNHIYVFYNPTNPVKREGTPDQVDYDFAHLELSKEQGVELDATNLSNEQARLKQELAEIYPMISELNAISEEMNKFKSFEAVLVADTIGGGRSSVSTATVYIKMTNLLNMNTWLWDRSTFINRKFIIEEMYQKFSEGNEEVLSLPKEEDPFWEPTEDVLIGQATCYLQPLSFAIELEQELPIFDYKGKSEGKITVGIYPCDQKGKVIEDSYCEDPDELLQKPYHFKVIVQEGQISKTRFHKGIQVRYKVYGEEDFHIAGDFVASLNPKFKQERLVSFPSLTMDQLEYLKSGSIVFCVYGKQEDLLSDPSKKAMNTKQLRDLETQKGTRTESTSALLGILSGDDKKLVGEMQVMSKKISTYERREARIKEICDEYSGKEPSPENYQSMLSHVSALFALEENVKAKIQAVALAATLFGGMRKKPSSGKEEVAPASTEEVKELRSELSQRFTQIERQQTQMLLRLDQQNQDIRASSVQKNSQKSAACNIS